MTFVDDPVEVDGKRVPSEIQNQRLIPPFKAVSPLFESGPAPITQAR